MSGAKQSYILTLFNAEIETFWEELHDQIYETGKVVYLGSQLEQCPETNRIHWQAFIKFTKNGKQRGTWFKRFHNSIHFVACSKERAEAINYGTKAETRIAGPKESGIKPIADPKFDITTVKDLILAGNKQDLPVHLVLRHNLENRYDGLKAFWSTDNRAELPQWLENPWGKLFNSRLIGKRRHLWIFSRLPDKGKTFWFAKPLEEKHKAKICCGDMMYWNLNGEEEAIILDEYNSAKLKWDQLNSICDGTWEYRRIYKSNLKLDNPLIIILSNQSINDLYPFKNQFLHARFIEHEIL